MKKFLIEKSKDGMYILKVNLDNREVYIGSKYNNKREIDKFIAGVAFEAKNNFIIIIGLGIGDYLKEMLKHIDASSKIIIFESNKEIVDMNKNLEELKEIFFDNRIIIKYYVNYMEVYSYLKEEINIVDAINLKRYVFLNYDKVFEEDVNEAIKGIDYFKDNSNIAINTNTIYSEKVVSTFFQNIPYMIEAQNSIFYKDKFKGETAVIVSAGASLVKNIDILKEYQEKVIIITGPRNVRILLEKGIKPDFICILDMTDKMYDFIKDINLIEIPFVITEQTNNKCLYEHKTNNIFCSVHFDKLIEEIKGEEIVLFEQEGSVSHLCTSFAKFIGCKNIVFIGQDLAFEDGKIHFCEEEKSSVELLKDVFLVEGNYTKKVATNSMFNDFRIWFEQFINSNKQVNFINCTEGGAKINGTAVTSLKSALEGLSSDGFNKAVSYSLNYSKISKDMIEESLYKIIKDLKDIKVKNDNAIKLNQEILINNNDDDELRKIFLELKNIDDYIEAKSVNDLISILLFPCFEMLMTSVDFKESIKDTKEEAIIKINKRNKILYENYKKYIDIIYEAFDNLIREYGG